MKLQGSSKALCKFCPFRMNQNDIFKNESYFLLIIDQNTPEVDVMVMFPLLPSQDLVQSIRNREESD